MYKEKYFNYNDKSNLSHEQKYYIYQWSNLLSFRTLELEKPSLAGVRRLLTEILDVFFSCEEKGIDNKHIEKLSDEIIEIMKNNSVLKKYYNSDYNIFLNILEKVSQGKHEDIKHVKEVISAFLKKLNKNYYNYLVDYLKELLSKSRPVYKNIDQLANQIINDLVYQGYSQQYLYEWGLNTYIYENDKEFFQRLDKLKSLEVNQNNNYNCIFILEVPDIFLEINQKNQDIDFFDRECELYRKFSYFDEVNDLNYDGKIFAVISEKAMDRFSAIDSANLRLMNLVKLFQISNSSYKPKLVNRVIVFNKNDFWSMPLKNKEANIEMKNHLKDFFSVYIGDSNENYNKKTVNLLNKVLHWCRIANESPLESKFLSLWTALEFMLTTSFTDVAKIKPILDYVPAFIGVYYPRRLILEIWFKTQEYFNLIPDEYKKELNLNWVSSSLNKTVRLKKVEGFLKLVIENGEGFINSFESSDFVKRQLRWLNNSLNEKKLFFNKIVSIENQVKNDLRRLYRLRNLLVHNAYIGEKDLKKYIERLVFYLEVILKNILYDFRRNREHNLLELLIARKNIYENLFKKMKYKKYPDILPRHLVCPDNIFIN